MLPIPTIRTRLGDTESAENLQADLAAFLRMELTTGYPIAPNYGGDKMAAIRTIGHPILDVRRDRHE